MAFQKGHTIWLGCKHSDETRKKMSEYSKNRSKEHRRKLSKALKGRVSPMKGRKHTEESKRKMSEIQKGKIISEETRKKLSKIQKGKIHSEETKRKMSESHKRIKAHKHTEETKRKLSEINKGKKHTEESKRKMSESSKGHICSFKTRQKISKANKGSKRTEEAKRRMSISSIRGRKGSYCDAWADQGYKNDLRKSACEAKDCGITNYLCLHMFGCVLSLHHINGSKEDCRPENIRTLCSSCHGKYLYKH